MHGAVTGGEIRLRPQQVEIFRGRVPEADYRLVLFGKAHLGQADALLLVHLR